MGDQRGKRSKFEVLCADVLEPAGFLYEHCPFEYVVERRYTPDFQYGDVLVECKGWFRQGDRQKYKSIRDCLPDNYELVFLLMSPGKIIQRGGRLTMGGWCDKEGLKWFSNPQEVIDYVRTL